MYRFRGLVMIVVLLPDPSAAGEMIVPQGTLEIGGVTEMEIDVAIPDQGDPAVGYLVAVTPRIGYFVADGLELELGAFFLLTGGDLFRSDARYGAQAGLRWFLTDGAVLPYLGLDVGLESGGSTLVFAKGRVGLVIPLNAYVGLDMGVQISAGIPTDGSGIAFRLPAGILGVSTFF